MLFGAISFIAIYFLHLAGFVSPENEFYVRPFLLGAFIVCTILVVVNEANSLNLFSNNSDKGLVLPFFGLSLLLIATIFNKQAGTYSTGIFIAASLVFLKINKKFYQLNKIYLFLLLYVVLMIVGTIGTPNGFRFPATTLSFLLLPLAYCCFKLPKETLFRIGHAFYRCMLTYLAFCIIYWWFNFLYLDKTFFEWITIKLPIECNSLRGWDEQIRLSLGGTTFSAFYFVSSWAYYYHPSYISLVLFFGLIVGFYLYHEKNHILTVTKSELILYITLCLFVIVLMESRIGIVGFGLLIAASDLYYSKLKTSHFKIVVALYLVLSIVLIYFFNHLLDNFLDDNVRQTDYTLAVNYIKDHFWWGNGFSEQKSALEQEAQIIKNVVPPIDNIKTYTHNQFLGNMVQFGIWGLIVLLSMLFALIRYAIKSASYLLQMFLLVIILFMMIEEPLYGQKGFTIFTVFLTYFIAFCEIDNPKKVFDLNKKLKQKR